jgi:hypothetical protein
MDRLHSECLRLKSMVVPKLERRGTVPQIKVAPSAAQGPADAIIHAGSGLNREQPEVMTRNPCACVLVASALLTSGATLGAEQFGTAVEARAMLDRAVVALKANEAAALKAFNDEKNKDFRDRDLYIFCFSLPDGIFTAYQTPLMLGTGIRELKLDKDPVGQRAYDAVAQAEEGDVVSIDYSLPKPGLKQPAAKQSLETRIGNQACGVSYFK